MAHCCREPRAWRARAPNSARVLPGAAPRRPAAADELWPLGLAPVGRLSSSGPRARRWAPYGPWNRGRANCGRGVGRERCSCGPAGCARACRQPEARSSAGRWGSAAAARVASAARLLHQCGARANGRANCGRAQPHLGTERAPPARQLAGTPAAQLAPDERPRSPLLEGTFFCS